MKKNRTIILSSVAILSCLAVVAAGTYALFTDQVTISNHLQAGSMDVTLKRTNLVSNVLTDQGLLDEVTSTEVVDFTNTTTRNVFDLDTEDRIVPGSYYKATMEISNLSSVAFNYWIEIVPTSGQNTELAEQLDVSVTTFDAQNQEVIHDENGTATAKTGIAVGTETAPLDQLLVNEKANFVVTVSFAHDANNNDAMNDEVEFDMIVYAVQATEAL